MGAVARDGGELGFERGGVGEVQGVRVVGEEEAEVESVGCGLVNCHGQLGLAGAAGRGGGGGGVGHVDCGLF